MASLEREGSNTSLLVKLLQAGVFMQMTCAWDLESTVRLQRMLNPVTAWLLRHEGQSRLAVLGICQAASQVFLALDTGHTIVRHQWVVLLMPPAVIARVNLLGKAESSLLTFTDWHGRKIGDYIKDPELIEEDEKMDSDRYLK